MNPMASADEVDSSVPPPPPDPLYTLRPHAGEVTDIKFLPLSSENLVIGSTTGYLGLWDLPSKRETWRNECSSSVISVNKVPTNNCVLSQLRNCDVTTWDLEKQTKLSSLTIERPGFCKLALLPAPEAGGVQTSTTFGLDCFTVAHSEYGKVNVYDCQTLQHVTTLSVAQPENKGMCMCVSMHLDQSTGVVYVLGGFEDGSVVIWDSRKSDKELASITLFSEPVMCMSVDNVRGSLVAGSATNKVEKASFNTAEQDVFSKKFSVELKNPGVSSIAIRSDGKIFCTGGWDGRIRVFGWKKGRPLAVLNYHGGNVNTCTFISTSAPSVYSDLIVCGSKDERVSIWKIY